MGFAGCYVYQMFADSCVVFPIVACERETITTKHTITLETGLTQFLVSLSGKNRSIAAITAYRVTCIGKLHESCSGRLPSLHQIRTSPSRAQYRAGVALDHLVLAPLDRAIAAPLAQTRLTTTRI